MSTVKERTKNVERVAEAHQDFNRNNLEAAAANLADNFTYTDHARGVGVRGSDAFVEWLRGWKESFSDGRIDEPEYIDAGNTVVTRFKGRGTNDGPIAEFPPSGRSMDVSMCEVTRFNDVGQMVSGEIFYDQLSILEQMGHMEPPETV